MRRKTTLLNTIGATDLVIKCMHISDKFKITPAFSRTLKLKYTKNIQYASLVWIFNLFQTYFPTVKVEDGSKK